MKRIVCPSDMKKWDQSCINSGIPSIELMRRAACGIKEFVRLFRKEQTVTCICGSGNNGGDGISLSWLLKVDNIPTRIVLLSEESRLTSDSAYFLSLAKDAGVPIFQNWEPSVDELLVDAIFGIGLDREVTGTYADLINKMNNSGHFILSADIPSGLDALTGSVLGVAVKATATITMQYIKPGLLLNQGPAYTGQLHICTLSDDVGFSFGNDMFLQEEEDVVSLLPPRPYDSHKGKNGHSLLCVGSPKYIGAALLSSRACLRTGCGILSVCTPDPVRPAFQTLPEAITIPTCTADWNYQASIVAATSLAGKSAVGIGCGLGSGEVSFLLKKALESRIPLCLDADGLNALSANRNLIPLLHENVVLTPHPGEMARLLDCSISDVLSDSLAAVQSFPCTILLKGPTTLVSNGNQTAFCTEGSPALAKGGSGDVLTGIITALLSQGLNPFDAARAGTYLLGTEAKKAMHILNERMLLASDIIDLIEQELHG